MEKVIITGPTGAIGIALIQELIKNKIYVTAVCRENSQRISNIPKSEYVNVVECNLERIANLPQMVSEKYDVFFHFAWDCTTGESRNNTSAQVNNIKYTIEAVEAACKMGCRRFVGAGSQAEYGRVEGILNAGTPTNPENGYGIAKLCAGQLSRIRCQQLNMDHIWTRILSVYGPFDGSGTMIMSAINKLLKGEKPSFTKGEQKWDYLYAKDAGLAMKLIAEKGISGKVYCIGSGKSQMLCQYIEILRDNISTDLPLGIGDIPYAPKQVMQLCADITELTQDTGFRPRYSFEEGIKETIEWCRGA